MSPSYSNDQVNLSVAIVAMINGTALNEMRAAHHHESGHGNVTYKPPEFACPSYDSSSNATEQSDVIILISTSFQSLMPYTAGTKLLICSSKKRGVFHSKKSSYTTKKSEKNQKNLMIFLTI